MKRLIVMLAILLALAVPRISCAQDFTYAGRFYLPAMPPIAHNLDIYLLNHLISRKGNVISGYMLYDVYYYHDHASDTGDYSLEYANQSFRFTAKVVPLNIYGKPMGRGLHAGTIVCDFVVAAQGAYGMRVTGFSVYDTESGQQLFTVSGDTGSEQLYALSAAEAILKMSGDHPVDGGESSALRGISSYPFGWQ